MGQSGSTTVTSTPPLPPSQAVVSARLTNLLIRGCFSRHEIHDFKTIFNSRAQTIPPATSDDSDIPTNPSTSSIKIWSEATLNDFLVVADAVGAGSVIGMMISYLAAFPFETDPTPTLLTNQALLRAITLVTGRHREMSKGTLSKSKEGWYSLIYRSLAVFDNSLEFWQLDGEGKAESELQERRDSGVDQLHDNDDQLSLSIFQALCVDPLPFGAIIPDVRKSLIPPDNLLRMIELMVAAATMDSTDRLQGFVTGLMDQDHDRIGRIRKTARCIFSSFQGAELGRGVTHDEFLMVVKSTVPFLFDGLVPLFEHFLITPLKDGDEGVITTSTKASTNAEKPQAKSLIGRNRELVETEPEWMLDISLISQISTFLPIFRSHILRPLYSVTKHGFSMCSLADKVFSFTGSTILLIRGRVIESDDLSSSNMSSRQSQLRDFNLSITSPKLPSSYSVFNPDSEKADSPTSEIYTYGAFIPSQWRATSTSCFSTEETVLFQLTPRMMTFQGSPAHRNYVYFNERMSKYPGLGFGSAAATPASGSSYHQSFRRSSTSSSFGGGGGGYSGQSISPLVLGPVSLHLDSCLQFGVFTHDPGGSGSCSFLPSLIGRKDSGDPGGSLAAGSLSSSSSSPSWQDRFLIEDLEVWGLDECAVK